MNIDEQGFLDVGRVSYLNSLAESSFSQLSAFGVYLKALGQPLPLDSCALCISSNFQYSYSCRRITIKCDACKKKLVSSSLKKRKAINVQHKISASDKDPRTPPTSNQKPARVPVDRNTHCSKSRANKLRKLAGLDDDKGPLSSNSSLLSFVNLLK